jgi:flagellar hook-length control protein FliK
LGQQLTFAQGATLAAVSANEIAGGNGIAVDTQTALVAETSVGIDPAAFAPNVSADASAAVASMLAQLNPNTNKAALPVNAVETAKAGTATLPTAAASGNAVAPAAAQVTTTPLVATTEETPSANTVLPQSESGLSATVKLAQQTSAATEPAPLDGNPASTTKQQNFAATLSNAQSKITIEPALFKTMEASPALVSSQPANTSAAMSQVLSSMSSGLPQQAAQAAVATPLNDARWPADFSQKVTWLSTTQNQVAELSLNPPDLGPLNVVLKITDNQATALFTSPHGSVRDAVENAMPKLREMLAESGITLGNATVSDQAPRERDTSAFSGNQSQSGNRRDEIEIGTEGSLPAANSAPHVSRHNGMIDTFA